MSTTREFAVGDRVVILLSGYPFDSVVRFDRIAKQYKNGNFVLAGDPTRQQWSKQGHATGKWGRGFFLHVDDPRAVAAATMATQRRLCRGIERIAKALVNQSLDTLRLNRLKAVHDSLSTLYGEISE